MSWNAEKYTTLFVLNVRPCHKSWDIPGEFSPLQKYLGLPCLISPDLSGLRKGWVRFQGSRAGKGSEDRELMRKLSDEDDEEDEEAVQKIVMW